MTAYTATYSPDDNKLRLYASTRLDAETYAKVKAAGFIWAPKQELFVAPTWSPDREDLLLELAGEIDDEDTTLVDRAEQRADRFADYADSRKADAEAARKAVAAIADNIPLGQPILVGHHSEKHARKDAERIENGMRKAIKMWETSGYWKSRASGAIRAAKYKERPDVRARRIKGLEADQRKQQKRQDDARKALEVWAKIENMGNDPEKQHAAALAFAGSTELGSVRVIEREANGWWSAWDVLLPDDRRYKACPSWTVAQVIEAARPIYARMIERCNRWLAHIANRLEYERAMLAEQGGTAADRFDIQPGGRVLIGREWLAVIRVNRKSGKVVSVTTTASYVSVRGIEEVKDYREPTADEAAKVAAVTKIPPLANYPGEGFVHVTMAEWEKYPKDYRGTKNIATTETKGRHRVRYVHGTFIKPREKLLGLSEARNDTERSNIVHSSYMLFITDAKRVDPPAGAGAPVEPVRFERQIEAPTPQPEHAPDTAAADFDAMRQTLREGVKVVAAPQLFPTPPDVAARMVELADIRPDMRVLEPSAGTGVLAKAIYEHSAAIELVENNQALVEHLRNTFWDIHAGDFLTFDLGKRFDRIVMNPPFAQGADIKHIRHALNFLKPGGRLVAICADGPRQQERLKPIASRWMPLPAGTFADQGTDVRTAMLIIDAPAQ